MVNMNEHPAATLSFDLYPAGVRVAQIVDADVQHTLIDFPTWHELWVSLTDDQRKLLEGRSVHRVSVVF